MATLKGNAVIGQSGGPTSVINQSLVGVIEEAIKAPHIDKLLGARHGVRGVINDDFLDLERTPKELLDRIANTPSAALGSTRDKPDQKYCEQIFDKFRQHNVRYFFYIGGNDSADTARIVQELAEKAKYDLHVFHVPKTIDNDLRVHDHTPGYGSAARFVACAIMGDNFDNRSLPGIKVDVIMGRNAGFLTAASVLARQHDNDGPHLIYVPEVQVSEEKFLSDVDRVFTKQGRCLIAVSEGIVAPNGKTWAENVATELASHGEGSVMGLEKDKHGNLQLSGSGALGDHLADLIKSKLSTGGKKIRVRADTFGYLQRSFPGLISDTDATEARLVGRMAVQYSADPNNTQGSVAMRRTSNSPYKIETFLTPLATVAKETKHLSPEYIVDGHNISDSFKEYARPLVGELPRIGTFDELK